MGASSIPAFAAVAEIAKFTAVRRRMGYKAANAILATLAERIALTPGCAVMRSGRTTIEFLVHASDVDAALATAGGLRASLELPVELPGLRFEADVCIGLSEAGAAGDRAEHFELAAQAAEDAYRRPERIALVGSEAGDDASQSMRLLAELADAIRADALELHYMPKLKLPEGTVSGLEALCRWSHPVLGAIPPLTFIGLAEESGLIEELTLWTLDRAIADQRRLIAQGHCLQIDVNLSARLVSNALFCERVIQRIAGAAGKIGLEITETAVIEDPQSALANLRGISEAGVHIAIDDYGAGLSSLTYLRDLPAQELKIDQSFIRKLTTSNRDPLLVRSAIEIARALEMEVTAEGVEDELALSLLSVMRCNYAQGYHISRALPLNDLVGYLESADNQDVTPTNPLLGGLSQRRGTA